MTSHVRVIKDYIKKGYRVEMTVDSTRPIYHISMITQSDVQSLVIPSNEANISELYNAVKGL